MSLALVPNPSHCLLDSGLASSSVRASATGLCHGLLLEVQVRLLAKARPFGILASTFTASVNNSGYRHFVSSQRWRDWRGQATQGERPRGLSQRAPNPY